jgi:hypothetical protein
MRRFHWFEFGDQPWLPSFLRDAMTAYLATVYRFAPLSDQWAAELEKALTATGRNEIVDLCSGSGGPMPLVAAALRKRGHTPSITLTDLYPRTWKSGDSSIRYCPQPVNVLDVPETRKGVRTMFMAFHHFQPDDARRILRSAVIAREPIVIFEGTSRSAAAIVSSIFIPLLVLLVTPAVRPVSWLQLLFTYLIPILPLLIFWDGLVSHLRTYTPAEMEEMSRDCAVSNYRWTAGSIPMRGIPQGLPFLAGIPVD